MRFVSVTWQRASYADLSPVSFDKESPSGVWEVHLSHSGRDREVVYRKSTEVADFNQEILLRKENRTTGAGVY